MLRKGHILVLSHQIGLRILFRLFLKRLGHSIDIVTTRTEAMFIIKDGRDMPDLVILDLYLDNESGLKLASDLRALHPQLPILLIPPRDHPPPLVPQEDIDAAAQMEVNILPRGVGIGGHSFDDEILKIMDHL